MPKIRQHDLEARKPPKIGEDTGKRHPAKHDLEAEWPPKKGEDSEDTKML